MRLLRRAGTNCCRCEPKSRFPFGSPRNQLKVEKARGVKDVVKVLIDDGWEREQVEIYINNETRIYTAQRHQTLVKIIIPRSIYAPLFVYLSRPEEMALYCNPVYLSYIGCGNPKLP